MPLGEARRPHRFGRMAPPLTDQSLILHPQQKKRSKSGAASMAEAGELNPLLPATERSLTSWNDWNY